MSGTDIFISYSREDRAHAKSVAHCLELEGFKVWWDDALHSGDNFDMVIEDNLNEAKAVVVLWSPRSVRSRWVRAEATLADRRKKLAPVIIEDCERPIIFELMHTADLSKWNHQPDDPLWKNFLRDLRRTMKLPADEGVAPAPQPGAPQAAPAPVIEYAPPAPPPAPEPIPSAPAPAPIVNSAPDEDESYEATQFFTTGSSPFQSTHRLNLMIEGSVAQSFDVGPLGIRIGRSEPADIVLSDRRVSRKHCVIEFEGDDLVVCDLGSTNGTFVDGERVDDKAPLPPGAVLRVGGFDLVHEVAGSGA